jgi:hypothetical protein
MSRERQVVWLNTDATEFAVVCESCLADAGSRSAVILARDACFGGSLSLSADVGFMTCRRGHRIVVRRAFSPIGALRMRA